MANYISPLSQSTPALNISSIILFTGCNLLHSINLIGTAQHDSYSNLAIQLTLQQPHDILALVISHITVKTCYNLGLACLGLWCLTIQKHINASSQYSDIIFVLSSFSQKQNSFVCN
ncbi:Hypothetical_protein [Hexamita inflata]|uniref:Hypothetical_protein n=1 Tax=Hexamita inflata TaxID=28002 RepID=A0AA86U6P1_9EUKA|nr:Hypothetical protein HINF_LOCUS32595 [Hexamita inflata]